MTYWPPNLEPFDAFLRIDWWSLRCWWFLKSADLWSQSSTLVLTQAVNFKDWIEKRIGGELYAPQWVPAVMTLLIIWTIRTFLISWQWPIIEEQFILFGRLEWGGFLLKSLLLLSNNGKPLAQGRLLRSRALRALWLWGRKKIQEVRIFKLYRCERRYL